MRIRNRDIDPELRKPGIFLRTMLLSQSYRTASMANRITNILNGTNYTGMNYEQHFVKRANGSWLRICVYYPKSPVKNATGVLWMQGGGYAIGSPEAEVTAFSDLVKRCEAVVVAPDYTKSTDAPYPAALVDCYLALQWMQAHTNEYGINAAQLVTGGMSAGGGLTAALSLYARDKGEVAIAFQMPIYPMIDDRATDSSANNDAPVWNSKSNVNSWRLYLGNLSGNSNISSYAAPARAINLTNLPPTITYVGSLEPFYDETVNYVKRLRTFNIPTAFKIFQGAYHFFDVLIPNATISQAAHHFLLTSFADYQNRYFAVQPK